MLEITCKLSGTKGIGVDAHIIPKAFLDLGSNNLPSVTVGSAPSFRPKRTRIGWYDQNIVTAQGEKILHELDDYAIKILLQDTTDFKQELLQNGPPLVRTLEHYNYKKLKLFALSLAWRASVSSRPEMQTINLGPHEEVIRNILLNNVEICADIYSVNIFQFRPSPLANIQINPVRQRIEEINYCRIYASPYTIMIKIDHRKTPRAFRGLCISPNRPLAIVQHNFSGSQEEALILKMAHLNKEKMPSYFKLDAE